MRQFVGGALVVASAVGLGYAAPAPKKVMPGAAVFQSAGCPQCHGEAGKGTDRGPSLIGVGRTFGRAKIVRQIREGGGEMPAFDEVLTLQETEDLADWLAIWKASAKKK